jgi:hypothetical protein
MHRTLQSLGALLIAATVSSAAHAQAATRVSQQPSQEVGPPMPVELMGAPRASESSPDAAAMREADDADLARTSRMSPMMAALTNTAKELRSNAKAGVLVNPRTHEVISAGASQAVVSLMTTPSAEADQQVRNAFSLSGLSPSAVDEVVRSLSHLLTYPSEGQARDVQRRYETFMNVAPSWFRDNPPAEALAVEAAFTRLNSAAAGVRPMDRRRPVRIPARERVAPQPQRVVPAPQRVAPEPEPVAPAPAQIAPAPIAPAPRAVDPAPPAPEKSSTPAPEKSTTPAPAPAPTAAPTPAPTTKPDSVKTDSSSTKKKSFWRKLITPAPERTP